MSKLAFTASGAACVATAVPVMHLLGRDPARAMAVNASTMTLFVVGWVLFAIGLAKPPPDTEEPSDAWKKRQVALSVIGVILIVLGVGAVRARDKLKLPLAAGASAFVAGWGVLTAGIVHSDPDYADMGKHEKLGRVIQSATSSLAIITGAALISMTDSDVVAAAGGVVPLNSRTLEAAAVATFVTGWLNAVSVSALQ